MGELTSKFSRDDIETLLEAANDWESIGSQEFHLMNMVRSAPMPPDDHEAFEMVQAIKDHFKKRERDIKESRTTRQERAVFLKAKLMLVRRDMGINQLFEMATENSEVASEVKETIPATEGIAALSGLAAKLERAEFFIRDLGVWDHYEKFVSEIK
jgi:hypothetical protein